MKDDEIAGLDFGLMGEEIDFLFRFLSGEVKNGEWFRVFDIVRYWGLEIRRRVVLGETSSCAMLV